MIERGTIEWVEVTDSTQNALLRHISAYDNMSVVAAELQTAGRGQRGNKWVARKGENLTFSMLLKFGPGGLNPLRAVDQFGITRMATAGVADYLEGEGIPCSIKWPNDIYVRGRKICGMLIENILDGEWISHSVVGIGLNVNQKEFPANLPNPTSMTLKTGEEYDLKEELKKLHSRLAEAFEAGSGSASYEDRLYRMGEFHEYSMGPDGTVFEGRIIGVTKSGMLQVEDRKGELREFAFKEISYII